MKERPILFSGPMVRAILEGRKWQTRRVVKFRDVPEMPDAHNVWKAWNGKSHQWQDGDEIIRCPYGAVGDRLWVRETLTVWPGHVEYDAAGDGMSWVRDCPELHAFLESHPRARVPSIHMPRWASRLTLEVTDVRVERVRDISGADAFAEGVRIPVSEPGRPLLRMSSRVPFEAVSPKHPREWGAEEYVRFEFLHLFYDINRRAPVAENPWVWVITFRRLEADA